MIQFHILYRKQPMAFYQCCPLQENLILNCTFLSTMYLAIYRSRAKECSQWYSKVTHTESALLFSKRILSNPKCKNFLKKRRGELYNWVATTSWELELCLEKCLEISCDPFLRTTVMPENKCQVIVYATFFKKVQNCQLSSWGQIFYYI